MNKILYGVCVASVFLLLSTTGCTKMQTESKIQTPKPEHHTENKSEKSNVPRVGFSIATDTFVIERWNKDIKIFSSEIAARGGEVLLQLSAGGTEAQIKQINYLVSQNIDALVVIPHDSELLAGVIKQVIDKGIPVIAYDRLIIGVPLNAFVSFDSEKVGALMAQALTERTPYGNYLIVNGARIDNNAFAVNKGIHSVLEPFVHSGRIRIQKEIWLDEWSFDEALQKVGKALEETTNFDAITAGNDQVAEAVLQLLAERRLAGKILVSGQDADLSACQHIVEGIQLMTVYKPINKLASRAADVTMNLIKGKTLEPDSYVENNSGSAIPFFCEMPQTVTADNMNETIIRDGFHSAQDVYRNQQNAAAK